MYGDYVFDSILGVNVLPGQISLKQESLIYSEYFVSSSLGTTPAQNRLKGWMAALWELRSDPTLGRDFADRALLFSLKALVPYDEDLNRHLRARLDAGIMVVENQFDDFIKINKVLDKYSLMK